VAIFVVVDPEFKTTQRLTDQIRMTKDQGLESRKVAVRYFNAIMHNQLLNPDHSKLRSEHRSNRGRGPELGQESETGTHGP
jgi:hypothetical protein